MQTPEPYHYPEPEKKEGMSLKTKWILGATGVAGTIGLIVWINNSAKKATANKSDRKAFTSGNVETKAKQFKMAFENDGYPGTNIPDLRELMRGLKSQDEYEAIAKEYEKQNNPKGMVVKYTLNNDMKKELQSSQFKEMLAIKAGKPLKAGQKVPYGVLYREWANRLKAAFEKEYGFMSGTDEGAIFAVFQELPTQKDFSNTAAFYRVQFSRDLNKDLQSELEIWELPGYMKMITSKPKG